MNTVLESKVCQQCNQLFLRPKRRNTAWWESAKFCSRQCAGKSRIGIKRPPEIGEAVRQSKLGIPLSLETRRRISNAHKGKPLSLEHRRKQSESMKIFCDNPEIRQQRREAWTGIKNPSWKGGITPEHSRVRHSGEYKEWRKNVFHRDRFTCQHCGNKGGKLRAHHIFPFALFPRIRFELSNGLTLCLQCHNTYGSRKRQMVLV